ncbi:AAA family ATPase [Xanthomonas arboricola]|uniref:AAA family ATPase n=1 Tax=Xanthomonas arboricola TaxID=56448 RepID=UPI000CED8D1F|nr:AAA family ATPase [Xanthomonas arboricola]PPU38396.1 hypothetical protein XaplCFBP3123_18175 [Xanthomonas arboricola pv. populi]
MLTKVSLSSIASFKEEASLTTDKKVNLVYGLNGSGKSTIGRFLRNPQDVIYRKCSLQGAVGAKFIVFNEDFIRENFFESSSVPGIFSLSKKNSEAERIIANASEAIDDISRKISADDLRKMEDLSKIKKERETAIDKIFDIKRKYSGGDRVLDYCLEGVLTNKDKLYDRLSSFNFSGRPPEYTVKDLQGEARLLSADSEAREELLPKFVLNVAELENHEAFKIPILGVLTGEFGEFINKLKHSDWVREGERYIDKKSASPSSCPFCQEKTIDSKFLENLNACFDKTFENKISVLKDVSVRYRDAVAAIQNYSAFRSNKFYDQSIDKVHQSIVAEIEKNIILIDKKIENPSETVELYETSKLAEEINILVGSVNARVSALNEKLGNRKAEFTKINQKFWNLMRWEYDHGVALIKGFDEKRDKVLAAYNKSSSLLNSQLAENSEKIREARKSTVNIDDAITKINGELVNIGIVDFSLQKHEQHLYRLAREGHPNCEFKTLSEGEKTIIAFLYFCELVVGIESPDETVRDRIVILDDPVSSLSHIFIFNIGRLIIHRLFKSNAIKQIFVLTHSLYFFYELTDIHKEGRDANQALFRVTKSGTGSQISTMKYEELQNDYHAYWQIINDPSHHPALLANCMRNIIEYFFGFVEKSSFGNVFQKSELSIPKFQAFNRYMNRESHSLGQNIFDIKEFDFEIFKEGLKVLFTICGYESHYKKMANIK